MELEEMKNLWQKYDKAMANNRILNEKLIEELMKNKSGSPIKKMMNAEYIGLSLCIMLPFIFLTMAGRAWESTITTVAFLVLIASAGYAVIGGIYKIRLLSGVDLSEKGITDVTYRVQRFKLIINKERLYGCVLFPLILIAAYIFVDGYDVNRLMSVLPRLAIGSAAGIAVVIVLYRSMYLDHIRTIEKNLEEVKTFRQEAV